MRPVAILSLAALASLSFGQSAPVLLKDVRVVVRPGQVIEKTSVLMQDGKIAGVGTSLQLPEGTQVVDCMGLTATASLINPWVRSTVTGVSPAAGGGGQGGPGGGGGGGGQGRPQLSQADQQAAQERRDKDPFGRENNLLTRLLTEDLKGTDVSTFSTYAKAGFGVVQFSASGGILGPASAVYDLGSGKADAGNILARPKNVGISLTGRGGFGGGYPGSTMGILAFLRQSLFDADRYGRLTGAGIELEKDPASAILSLVTSGQSKAVFEDLNEVSFFQAYKVAREFGLRPVFVFRQDAAKMVPFVKMASGTVYLRGSIPSKPTIGADLDAASLLGVRAYFNELQAPVQLEKLGVEWCYAPSSVLDPLEGIRAYVRAGLGRDAALAAMTTRPAAALGIGSEVGTVESGKRANIVLTQGDLLDSRSQVMATYVNGASVTGAVAKPKPAAEIGADEPLPVMAPNYEMFPKPAETTAAYRLYKNATVWTMGPQGIITGGDVLIRGGKVAAVGKNLKAPEGCEVVDATGKHISPGVWDCHSHTGIAGGVNEGSNMITAECRIRDVINHTDINIYQQLSGGTVGANQLHGSANAIGGQNSTVKWRWGQDAMQFPVEGAPEGVKFALGQNPIREDTGGQQQPNGTTLLTFRPRTRMGVEESIRRGLQLGKEYNQAWADFRAGKTKVEPRHDIQLEALGEIASGKRWIHSHGYRADELLMLIRVTKEFGAHLATLQHVLEGYKIADEMAEMGVAGSTFADWWGYKLEAYDAVPYNAALMAARGVSVSINSDSGDHARRLNHEAAKSIRYGGVSEEKALSFVTIEPCKQLGIDKHTGSLEVGKDADMVVWSDNPVNIAAVCLETYVDGVKRFDRANDAQQRADREKELLAAKALLADKPAPTGGPFDTGADPVVAPANSGPSKAKFGIGPVTSEPGTMRYARKPVLISGGMVHPMVGDPFVGDVLIGSNGKIEKVGKGLSAPSGAVKVNAKGKHVYPGLIDPATSLALNEIGQVPASEDGSERGNFHPDYRVERTINPEWDSLGVARQQGVLTVIVKPTGGGIAGQAALINTEGYTWEDLTMMGGVALAYSSGGGGFGFGDEQHSGDEDDCGVNHNMVFDDGDMMAGQRQGGGGGGALSTSLETLSGQLKAARDYASKVAAATPDKPVARDQRQEAMLLVAEGKMPVMLSANSAADIKAAVAWSESENVGIVLYGCSGAGEIAAWLAEKQVPICLAAVYSTPRAEQPVDYFYSLPAKLAKAGVKFCLTTNNDKDVRQIRDQAGWAAAYGMDREEAARLITLRTAEVLGVQDRLGSLAVGMDGTVIVCDGEIIETRTNVLRAFIQGREVTLTNRQTMLWDKYKTRPAPVGKTQ